MCSYGYSMENFLNMNYGNIFTKILYMQFVLKFEMYKMTFYGKNQINEYHPTSTTLVLNRHILLATKVKQKLSPCLTYFQKQ